jgi:hypothetical protein
LDRLSTWEEVRSAMSVSSQAVIAVVGDSDDLHKIDSDFGDIVLKLSEDTMWLAMAGKMAHSKSN